MRVLHDRTYRPIEHSELRSGPGARGWWAAIADVEEHELVFETSNTWLDPRSGIGFTRHERVPDFVHWSENTRLPSRRDWVRGIPRARRVRGAVVSLRDAAMEHNWYHFLVDLLGGRLRLVDEHVSDRLPAVVSANLPPQAMAVLRRPLLREREWVVQSDRWLRVDRAIGARTARHEPAAVGYLWDLLSVPRSDPSSADRLLVLRETGTGRDWANREEVLDVARRYGLRPIRPALLDLEEQIEQFGRASLVVGVHGAGLTGMLWRREAPLNVIDVQVHGRAAPMRNFAMLSSAMGTGYQALGDELWGPAASREPKGRQAATWKSDGVHVDPARLADAIEAALERERC